MPRMKKSPSELGRIEEVRLAREALSGFLDQVHIMDALVDRNSVLNVDSNLKMHNIIS